MRRKSGTLDKIDDVGAADWIESLSAEGAFGPSKALDRYRIPDRKLVAQMVDEELATVMARELGSKLGHMAASEMRQREAWRGPARWSLLIAALALAVSITALLRSAGV